MVYLYIYVYIYIYIISLVSLSDTATKLPSRRVELERKIINVAHSGETCVSTVRYSMSTSGQSEASYLGPLATGFKDQLKVPGSIPM